MRRSLFAADAEFLSREQAKALADRVLSFAKADETHVNSASGWNGNTRFAGNEITTSGGTADTNVTVTSTVSPGASGLRRRPVPADTSSLPL